MVVLYIAETIFLCANKGIRNKTIKLILNIFSEVDINDIYFPPMIQNIVQKAPVFIIISDCMGRVGFVKVEQVFGISF